MLIFVVELATAISAFVYKAQVSSERFLLLSAHFLRHCVLDAPFSSVQHDDCLALYWRHSEHHVGSYVADILVSLSPAYIHLCCMFS